MNKDLDLQELLDHLEAAEKDLERLRDGVRALAVELAADAEQHAVAELWDDPRWLLAERMRKLLENKS